MRFALFSAVLLISSPILAAQPVQVDVIHFIHATSRGRIATPLYEAEEDGVKLAPIVGGLLQEIGIEAVVPANVCRKLKNASATGNLFLQVQRRRQRQIILSREWHIDCEDGAAGRVEIPLGNLKPGRYDLTLRYGAECLQLQISGEDAPRDIWVKLNRI